jgi:hypothetical protein
MKKLILSIFVAVLFSFSNIAGNTTEKILNSRIELQIVQIENNEADDCNLEKFRAYTVARSQGYSHQIASAFSYQIYFECMGNAFN